MRLIAICAALLGLSACATGPLASDDSCAVEVFAVYFARDQVTLDPIAGEMLDRAAGAMSGCRGSRLQVAGFADAAGDPETNREISSQRAHAVFEGLLERGVTAEQVEILAVGEAGARGPDGISEPMRRRAEVRFIPAGV